MSCQYDKILISQNSRLARKLYFSLIYWNKKALFGVKKPKKGLGPTNNLRMKAGINQAGIHARRQNRDSEGHEWDGIRMSYGELMIKWGATTR